MSKRIAENSCALSIFWLKKNGYLGKNCSYKSGGITWTCGSSKNNIDFSVIKENWGTSQERVFLELRYTNTDYWSKEKDSMNYRIELVTTDCNYGGVRYWFRCPLSTDGQFCGRRVGVIYSIGKWFGCRHCGRIAYSAQMQGGKFRCSSYSYPDIDQKESELKRFHYRGKPTRKYRRVLAMRRKIDNDFIKMEGLLGERYRKIKKN